MPTKYNTLLQRIAKQNLFLFSVLLFSFLSACNCTKSTSNSTNTTAKATATYTISGRVQQSYSYCGGARPTDEMVKKLQTPIAFANKTFYIKKGNTNDLKNAVITNFKTDADGTFSIQLPAGTYAILVEEQLHELNAKDYTTKTQNVDEQCLAAWWAKPYYVLGIKDQNITNLNFIFKHRCFINNDIPCITYTGPMPH